MGRRRAPSMASRQVDWAFTIAMALESARDGVRYKGNAALALPRVKQVTDANGVVLTKSDLSGARHMMQQFTEAFEHTDHDRHGDLLDLLLDARRRNQSLQ
eukprot:1898672-Pyramimonas_sp.AAC.1